MMMMTTRIHLSISPARPLQYSTLSLLLRSPWMRKRVVSHPWLIDARAQIRASCIPFFNVAKST